MAIMTVGNTMRAVTNETTKEFGWQYKIQLASACLLGEVLHVSATAEKYEKSTSGYDCVYVAAEAGTTNDFIWAWRIGSARCLCMLADGQTSTAGYLALGSDTDGRIYNIDVPIINPAEAEHFREVGHVVQTVSSGTDVLVLVDTHAN